MTDDTDTVRPDDHPIGQANVSPGAPSEDADPYDGPFSYAKEYHAFAIGVGVGMVAGATQRWEVAALVVGAAVGEQVTGKLRGKVVRQLGAEPWYALGGLALGVAVGLGVGRL
jgi:hypothetical protein